MTKRKRNGINCPYILKFRSILFNFCKNEKLKQNAVSTHLMVSRICCCLVAQSCLTLCDPADCSPPGSSVRGVLQARRLAWAASFSSRASSPHRAGSQSHASCVSRWSLTTSATLEALCWHRRESCKALSPQNGLTFKAYVALVSVLRTHQVLSSENSSPAPQARSGTVIRPSDPFLLVVL